MPYYLDTSGFLKLIVAEAESAALRTWLAADDRDCWSSQLLLTESLRAANRLGLDQALIVNALDLVSLVLPAATTFHAAATLEPKRLRSLDALHLATALEIGPDLQGVVTYDERLTEAAQLAGLTVIAPA